MKRTALWLIALLLSCGLAYAGDSTISVKDSALGTRTYYVKTTSAGNLFTPTTLCDTVQGTNCAVIDTGGNQNVAITSAQNIGALTDSACAGDATSGCSILQRLQRIAQNLTTLNTSVNSSIPAGSALVGVVNTSAAAFGGSTPGFINTAATSNATLLKSSAGIIYSLTATTTAASVVDRVVLYDSASATVACSVTPKFVARIPAAATGAGFTNPIPTQGLQFNAGIVIAIMGGNGTTDCTAAQQGHSISYSFN